jgi:hypothetical protein
MMTFVKTILIVLLVYYGLKFLIKLAAPYLMRYVSKKASQKFGAAFRQESYDNTNVEEGNVSIDKMPSSKSKSKNTVGEYVDFEEVD